MADTITIAEVLTQLGETQEQLAKVSKENEALRIALASVASLERNFAKLKAERDALVTAGRIALLPVAMHLTVED